jgi:putative Ca2+/H+ antiporter (TMEM165/GDT1 family)
LRNPPREEVDPDRRGALILTPFLAALAVIALAELGDKTQLLTFGFAARYPFWQVISAVACATAALMAAAVIFGGFLNQFIPLFYVQLFAGSLFILFGLWTLFGKDKDEDKEKEKGGAGNPFWIVFGSFFLAELGDKTQLATLALSAKYGAPFQVWLGATLGMIIINLISVLAGGWTRRYIPEKVVKYVGAAVFILFGLWTFFELFRA